MVEENKKAIYLDNAATSHPKPESVYRAVCEVLRSGGSASRSGHQASMAADQLVFSTRELLAELFNGAPSDRFILTPNATAAINLALFGLLKAGDRVVTTSMEHNAVARPLRELEDRGVEVVKVVASNTDGQVDTNELKQACREKSTRLLIINHCSNVFGTIQPLTGLGDWCRRQGILFMVDGSQTAGLLPIDIHEMDIDLLAAPGHKGLLGPQGTGFLYVGAGIDLAPLVFGGTGANSSSERQPLQLPERFESGTYNLPGIAGLHAALEFIIGTGIDNIRAREKVLIDQLVSGLRQIDRVMVYGPEDLSLRGAAVSFNIDGCDPAEVGFLLDQEDGIAVRVGLHCAPDAHRTLGTFPIGTVRVSPGYFNTERQIEIFLRAISRLSQAKTSV